MMVAESSSKEAGMQRLTVRGRAARAALVALATISASALLVGASAGWRTGLTADLSTAPGVHSVTTGQGGCLEAWASFSVNEYTYSVDLSVAVLDPVTGEFKSPIPSPIETRNVTPGSSGHIKTGTGYADGDSLIFSLKAWSGPNGTGTYAGSPKRSQTVSDCVE
jgi:hypothetical protein